MSNFIVLDFCAYCSYHGNRWYSHILVPDLNNYFSHCYFWVRKLHGGFQSIHMFNKNHIYGASSCAGYSVTAIFHEFCAKIISQSHNSKLCFSNTDDILWIQLPARVVLHTMQQLSRFKVGFVHILETDIQHDF